MNASTGLADIKLDKYVAISNDGPGIRHGNRAVIGNGSLWTTRHCEK